MPLEVSSKAFTEEWQQCYKNPNRDTAQLLKLVYPFLNHWELLLTCPEYPRDIHFMSLYTSLGNQAKRMIEDWIEDTILLTSVKEILELIFFEQLRNMDYYPDQASILMQEYVLARNFGLRLKSKIRSCKRNKIDTPVFKAIFAETSYEDNHPDFFLNKHAPLTSWEWYLVKLRSTGLSVKELTHYTLLSRETFYYEEKQSWQYLKQKHCAPEA